MRWTPEKVEELRGLAHLGGALAGRMMNITTPCQNEEQPGQVYCGAAAVLAL
jgi:hypothetical protein